MHTEQERTPQEMARDLDCLLDDDLQRLADVKASTTEAWRKRGTGPAYVRIGRTVLYPQASLRKFLEARIKRVPEVS
jgi:hypothetical protein